MAPISLPILPGFAGAAAALLCPALDRQRQQQRLSCTTGAVLPLTPTCTTGGGSSGAKRTMEAEDTGKGTRERSKAVVRREGKALLNS